MPLIVGHHFRCPECDYDLFTSPLDGKCPECGKPIPKRKGLEKSKNPRRVNSQHRAQIRLARRNLWRIVPVALAGFMLIVSSLWFPVPLWLQVVSGILVLVSAWAVLNLWTEIAHHSERLVPDERDRPDNVR